MSNLFQFNNFSHCFHINIFNILLLKNLAWIKLRILNKINFKKILESKFLQNLSNKLQKYRYCKTLMCSLPRCIDKYR